MGRAASRRILVVDDDLAICESLTEVLVDEGYTVETAADGALALQAMRRGPLPDLVLIDFMMPVLDGRQFRAIQRSDPMLASVPVILLTAVATGVELSREFDDCLPKPLSLELLLGTIAARIS
jgi:CheY-like chemotaxis protein